MKYQTEIDTKALSIKQRAEMISRESSIEELTRLRNELTTLATTAAALKADRFQVYMAQATMQTKLHRSITLGL